MPNLQSGQGTEKRIPSAIMMTLWLSNICPSDTVVPGMASSRKSPLVQEMIAAVAKGDRKKLRSENKQNPLMLSKQYRSVEEVNVTKP